MHLYFYTFYRYTYFVYLPLDIFEYRVGCNNLRLEKFDQHVDQIIQESGSQPSKDA